MTRLFAAARSPFRALEVRNYRLFFFGQVVSVSGTWMQSLAQAWLVLKLTNSGALLGLVIACQTIPMLVAGAWGGIVADRFDKRRALVAAQAAAAVLALLLGVLTVTGVVTVWMVAVLAFGLGCTSVIDLPTRQAFVMEMVDRDRITNAVSLNGVIMNGGRLIGPAIGGVLIATVGIAACFFINSASYLAVIAALLMMRRGELFGGVRVPRAPGQLMEGLRYVWRTPALRTPLLMMALIGTFAYEFQVTLALLARFTFHADATALGLMNSAMATGAVLGGLITASRGRTTPSRVVLGALLFGAAIILTALAPNLLLATALLVATGAASIFFAAMANSSLQLGSAPEMRGRVMALYTVAFMGSTPIGGPLVGWIGQVVDPRAALGIGGVAAVVAAALAWRSIRRATHAQAVAAAAPGHQAA